MLGEGARCSETVTSVRGEGDRRGAVQAVMHPDGSHWDLAAALGRLVLASIGILIPVKNPAETKSPAPARAPGTPCRAPCAAAGAWVRPAHPAPGNRQLVTVSPAGSTR